MRAHLTLALPLALATTPALALDLTPDYATLSALAAHSANTHNDDKLEASNDTTPGIGAALGWTFAPYLAGEVRLAWHHQRAHGCNDGQCGVPKDSINGTFDALSAHFTGMLRYPNPWVTPYIALGVGPAYTWTDTTRGLYSLQRGDEAGVVLSYEGAVGLERELSEMSLLASKSATIAASRSKTLLLGSQLGIGGKSSAHTSGITTMLDIGADIAKLVAASS